MRFSALAVLSFVASTSGFVPVAHRHNVGNPFATRPLNTALFSLNESNGSESTTPARKPARIFNFDPGKYRMDPVIPEAPKSVETVETNPSVVNPGAPKSVDASPNLNNVETPKLIDKAPIVNKPETPKPVETTPASMKPETTKPVETTPASMKPGTPKPVETTPAAMKPETPIPVNNTPALMIPETSKPLDTTPQLKIPATPKPLDAAPSAIKLSFPQIDLPKEPMALFDDEENARVFASAPLIVAPLVALAAGRDALAKNSARRDQLQKQIDKLESKKKEISSVDPGGITKAIVRSQTDGITISLLLVSGSCLLRV
jgi:hypothetical protein